MAELTLVLGNRNFSSWSMRAWLVLEQTGAPFEERTIYFDEDDDRAARKRFAPTGRVPVLIDGELAIWDSLAITEHLNERFPDAGLWPSDPAKRARARSVACEMHSGFEAMRERIPLNCRARHPYKDRGPDVADGVARIESMWEETREEFGSDGPFLFGSWCAADAFYAPIASRFVTYGIELSTRRARAYAASLLAHPPVARWMADAETEGHEVEQYARMT